MHGASGLFVSVCLCMCMCQCLCLYLCLFALFAICTVYLHRALAPCTYTIHLRHASDIHHDLSDPQKLRRTSHNNVSNVSNRSRPHGWFIVKKHMHGEMLDKIQENGASAWSKGIVQVHGASACYKFHSLSVWCKPMLQVHDIYSFIPYTGI